MPSFLSGAFIPLGASGYGWETLYASYRWETSLQLFHVRNRAYHPRLETWIGRDPLGYADGINMYLYCHAQPTLYTDPSGEWVQLVLKLVTIGGSVFAVGVLAANLCAQATCQHGAVQCTRAGLFSAKFWCSGTVTDMQWNTVRVD